MLRDAFGILTQRHRGRRMMASGTVGARPVCNSTWTIPIGIFPSLTVVISIVSSAIFLPLPHSGFPSNADTTSLFSNYPAQRRTIRQSRELLGTEDVESLGEDLHAVGNMWTRSQSHIGIQVFGLAIQILDIFELLIQVEAETVCTLVANRQIREDKVSSLLRTIQVYHTGDGCSSQDTCLILWLWLTAHGSNGTSRLQCGEEEVARIHLKSNVLKVVAFALEDLKFNNWRWVHWPTVGRG